MFWLRSLAIVLLFFIGSTSAAYAYLDPATGSIILQGVLAALAGAAFFIAGYWRKLRSFFSRKKDVTVEESEDSSSSDTEI